MAERPEVRCRLVQGGPPGTGTPSRFVLRSETGGGRTIHLLDGDNIVEVDSTAQGFGAGLDVSEQDVKSLAVVYDKQVVLRTTNTPRGLVLLKASTVVRIRGRPQSASSASPRKASPSPSLSPAKSARDPPSPSNTKRWSGGGSTWVNPDAQQYLLVGDTLDFGVGGAGRNFRCRFSFTLYLASTVAAEAAGGGSSSSGSGSSGCGGGGGGTKRRLEGTFADNSGDVHLLPKPPPAAIEIDDSSDDEGHGATPPAAGAAAAATASPASAPAPAVTKRRQRDRDRRSAGGTPSKPVEVVDLCGAGAAPRMPSPGGAGTSNDQPLDLCMFDEEDDAGGSAVASGARETPIPPRGSGGGGCSSGGGRSGSSASPNERVEPERRVPPPARIDGDVPEPGVSRQRQEPRTAVPAAVDADLSLVEAAPPTTIENDQPEPPPPSPPSSPSSPFRSLSLKPSSSPRTSSPSPLVQEEEEMSVSVSSSPAQRSLVWPCHAAGGGGGSAGPMAELSTPPTRTRPRMPDDLRNFLKVSMRVSHEYTAPVVDEFLARGMAPHSTLCRVIMAALLKSRCSVRNEYLRRQLRAMLDVDPDCWEPPVDDAPAWLEEVMRGMTTGKASTSPAVLPKDADGEARAGAEARAAKEAPSVVEARAIVLEVVVDYLAAGRRERCSTPLPTPPPVQDGPPPTSTSAVSRIMMHFFPQKEGAPPRRNIKESTRAKKNAELARRDARLAVETSAAWAVGMWGSTLVARDDAGAGKGTGTGTGAARNRLRRRRRRQDSPALARSRLVATRFLAEVVEACGLPVSDACVAIRDQMNSFSGVPGVAAAGAGASTGSARYREPAAADAAGGAAAPGARDAGCPGLGAAARGGLVRALFGRSFCPELARVLRDDLGSASGCSPRADMGEVGRLRALLSRMLRKAEGGLGADLLLLVGG